MSINFGSTFDPYALDENKVRVNKFNIANGGGLLRLTSANINMNYLFSSTQLEGNREEGEEDLEQRNQREATSSGGRDDDLFGRAEDFTDRRMNDAENTDPHPLPHYRSKYPGI